MALIPQTLYMFNLSLGGIAFNGDVPALTLPKLKIKTAEYQGGGMDAPIDMDQGMEKMEASFSTKGARKESMKYFGLSDQTAFDGVFRGSFKGQKGATVAVVATLRGMVNEVDPGEWKPAGEAEFKYAISVSYYKLEVGGVRMYEIDPVNCVRVINGVDQLASVRRDLGL